LSDSRSVAHRQADRQADRLTGRQGGGGESGHLDAGEGDGRGGVGADHQGDEGGAQVPEHVGQLQERTPDERHFKTHLFSCDRGTVHSGNGGRNHKGKIEHLDKYNFYK